MIAATFFSLVVLSPAFLDSQSVAAAMEHYAHGRFQSAWDDLSGLARTQPQDAVVLLWLGKTGIKLHRWNEAIKQLERAVALDPKNGLMHLWLGRAYGGKAAHSFIVNAYGWARKTRQEFETAANLAPDDLDIRFDLLEFYTQAPGLVGGGKDKAEAQAEEIAKRDPRMGYLARAQILEDKKEWDQALQELLQAASKYSDYAGPHVDLAELYLRRHDYKAAEASARRALALHASNRAAKLYRAVALIHLHQDLPDALSVLQELAAGPLSYEDPGFEEVYYWLGQAYLASGQKADARQAFETSLGFDPDYSRSKQALAQIKSPPDFPDSNALGILALLCHESDHVAYPCEWCR
jgi:predicted Zn-dependent protease